MSSDSSFLDRRQMLLAALLSSGLGKAFAQSGGVSRIIVPFAPGGAREMPARAIQQELSQETGQNWIIESKPGAGGAIGTAFVSKAAPDGKTLLMAASSHFVTSAMGARPFYDPVKEFAPVANIGNQSYVLIVNAGVPAKTAAEFIQYARSKPGVLNYNSAGVGSSTHLAMAYFAKTADIDMVHVPYKGTAEAATDVSGGRGNAVIVPTAGVGVYLQDTRLRVIGITSKKRSPLLPNIPTLAESGLAGFHFESWFGLLAPAGTPVSVVNRIQQEVAKAMGTAVVKEKLLSQGAIPGGNTPDEFVKFIDTEHKKWAQVVKTSGAKVD